jgi:uncharacterized protein (TIGR02270 family)
VILTFIPDILEEHVDEIAFLWDQRRTALCSPDYTMRELGMLEERIEAHVSGVLAVGENALPFLNERLASEDRAAAFAAAYSLLRLRIPSAVKCVLDGWNTAADARLAGISEAMCHGQIGDAVTELHARFFSAPPPAAIEAARILSFHTNFRATSDQLATFLRDENPAIKRGAWHLLGLLGQAADPKEYASAMRDEDPTVRAEAALAAAWARVPGILNFARQLAENPSEDHLPLYRLLAILGAPADRPRLEFLVRAEALGPARFGLAATYGHPALVDPVLLPALDPDDPERAEAARRAFTKVTGCDISSDNRATIPPKSDDPVDAEFADDVMLPDVEKARTHWRSARERLATAGRLIRGTDISRGAPTELFAQLDMESRWEIWLRSRFEGVWAGLPTSLEVFPQQRA